MAETNVESARRGFEAALRGDLDAIDEKLVTTGPTGFALITRLPNGKRVEVPLGTARRRTS